jgi:hypothetical protein
MFTILLVLLILMLLGALPTCPTAGLGDTTRAEGWVSLWWSFSSFCLPAVYSVEVESHLYSRLIVDRFIPRQAELVSPNAS